jgi:hypothetical protein
MRWFRRPIIVKYHGSGYSFRWEDKIVWCFTLQTVKDMHEGRRIKVRPGRPIPVHTD